MSESKKWFKILEADLPQFIAEEAHKLYSPHLIRLKESVSEAVSEAENKIKIVFEEENDKLEMLLDKVNELIIDNKRLSEEIDQLEAKIKLAETGYWTQIVH